MALDDLGRFHLKRVNPFQGLVIDADAWRDAHNYHREQLRLHTLAFHETGIVTGLSVSANNPADLTVVVEPGMGVDSEGNVIVVSQRQRYKLQTQKAGLVHLVVQFREVPGEPYQPPNGGQPTRMLDAYRIEERDKLPSDPYLELGRIDFDPAGGSIRDARAASSPGKNEIDLRFRKSSRAPMPETAAPKQSMPQPAPPQPSVPAAETAHREPVAVVVGHMVLGDAPEDLHVLGLQNLCRELSQGDVAASVEQNISLDKDLKRCAFLYLAGNGGFELNPPQKDALDTFLGSGGVIMGESCSDLPEGSTSRAPREFGLAFNQLAGQLKRKMEIVKRGHPLLSARHVFSEVPQGAENGMLLEGGRMLYSGSDYGCAWCGGHTNQPLPRETIRAAFEFGINIAIYARPGR